jgi:hypothetical protein
MKVVTIFDFEGTWWRLLQSLTLRVSDEGCYNLWLWGYLMKVVTIFDFEVTWWRLLQSYALFIEFYYALFLFLFFKDMHYNTMIRTFCIMKKITFTAFHYLNLSSPTFVDPEKITTEVYRFSKLKKKKNSFVLKFKISQKFQNFKIVNKGLGSPVANIIACG